MKRRSGLVVLILWLLFEIQGLAQATEAPLQMGVFPRRNAQLTVRMFRPLAEHLSGLLGREVQLRVSKDFASFWADVEQGSYDLVHFNQLHYVRSQAQYGYQVLAMNEEFGRSRLRGALYVRQDSGIERVEDLRGRKIIFGGGPQAMMAYVAPTYLLRQVGLQAADYQAEFARNPPNALMAIFYRQADAGGAGEIAKDLQVVREKIDSSQMKILATGEPIAHLPWAVRPGLDPELVGRLRQALLGLAEHPKGSEILRQARMTNIVPAEDADYAAVRRIIAAVASSEAQP